MKEIIKITVAVLTSLMFAACGGNTDMSSPKGVAEKIISATKNIDFETLEQLISENYLPALEKAKDLMKIHPEIFASIKKQAKQNKFKIISEDISEDGNSATVKIKLTAIINGESLDFEQSANFIKTEGKWKGDFDPFSMKQ
jgi:hypothetical protein